MSKGVLSNKVLNDLIVVKKPKKPTVEQVIFLNEVFRIKVKKSA